MSQELGCQYEYFEIVLGLSLYCLRMQGTSLVVEKFVGHITFIHIHSFHVHPRRIAHAPHYHMSIHLFSRSAIKHGVVYICILLWIL